MTTDDTTQPSEPAISVEDQIAVLQAENQSLQAEIDRMQLELDAKQAEAPESLKELAARAQADLQNAKDRLEREKRDIRQYALEGTVVKLLPTIDNLQRAFAHLPADLANHEWVKGVAAVEKELMTMLAESGFVKIDTKGQTIDTQYHEVLQMGPGAKDVILDEFEAGYTLNSKVLRPAKVKVGDGSE